VTCEQLTPFVPDYLAGKLSAETTLAFAQHVQGSSDCLPFLNTYRKTIDAVRSLCDMDIPTNSMIVSDDPANEDETIRVLGVSGG
jgi:Putative zinc-finger